MATSSVNANISAGGAPVVIPGSCIGKWVVANTDLTATAQSTAGLYNPAGVTASTIVWRKVSPGCTRILVQARVPKATTAVGTFPVIAVVGAYRGTPDLDQTADITTSTAGQWRFVRLDATLIADAGVTLNFAATAGAISTSTTLYDSTYFYSYQATKTGYDLLGAEQVGIFTMTAGACTASAAMPCDICLLN